MKLNNSFFKILNSSKYQDKIEYTVRLDSEHFIYGYHFPGNPVTPGVCIIQMVKELVAENATCPLFLQKIVKVRYFKAINPVDNAVINISLNISEQDDSYSISATVFSGDAVFSQLSLILRNAK
jgi:3-hydroxyacyl-[acyl-carrier-protein] dehydratase